MLPEATADKWQPPPSNMENIDASYKWWSLTYFFREWNEEENWIYPCFGIIPYQDETLELAYKNKDFHKVEIFGFDVEIRDERRFNLLVNMEKVFLHFFKEVFEIKAFEQGYHYSFDLCRIGLPKKSYDDIMNVIKEHSLTDVWELIFFIIAKAQEFYDDNVRFIETKEQREIIRNIGEEINKAINLVERVVKDPFGKSAEPKLDDKLLRINFIFQNSQSVQIKDPMLAQQFVRYFKEGYNDGYFKDWKLQLQASEYVYESDRLREQFRFRYAKALYNFFTQSGLIKLSDKPFPNNLLKCIYKIIDFSLIRIETKSGKESDKIKVVRNWIKDHTLVPGITFEKIQPNLEKLYKYFDKEFIDCVDEIKRADAIRNGLSLCLQFKTQTLQNEIIHLAACLREWHWRVSQQLERGPIIPDNALPKEYDFFKLFINSTVENKKFEKITFKIAGDEKIYDLTDRLPIHFIENAVRYHYRDFREDYETDLLQAEIKNGSEPGSFYTKTTGSFNLPEERFFPRIVTAFFNFLQNEAPPLEKEYKPTDRYYSLIAKALQITSYFRDSFPEDDYLKSKVEYWHSLIKQ